MERKFMRIRMQKINFRKIQYLSLFLVLNLVEWLKATQTGDVWKVAVNLSGLAVLALVMSGYSRKELFGRFSKISAVICLVGIAGVYGYWHFHRGSFLVWQILTAILNLWLISIILWVLWKRYRRGQLKRIKWDITGILWLVLSGLMIFSVSGRIWPIWHLIMYGMFYLTEYSKEEKKAMMEGMVNGTILSFFLMQSYAFGFRPFDEARYKGPLSNCNMTALYYLIVYCMLLVKLHWLHGVKKAKWLRIFCFLLAAGLLGFVVLTLCRTAWLSAAAVTFVYGIWVMKRLWKDKITVILGKAVLFGAVTLMMFPVVFYSARWLPTILHRPVWYEGEWSEEKVHSFDPADSSKYVTMEEFLEAAVGRFATILIGGASETELEEGASNEETSALQGAVNTDRTDTAMLDGQKREEGKPSLVPETGVDGQDAAETIRPILNEKEEYTSSEIRVAIFKAYWKDLNLWGHSEKEGYYQITKDYKCWHAQNLWLQIAYYFGIPAGIIAIILTVVLIAFYLISSWRSRLEPVYGVLPLLFVILYFSFGILEVVWNPGQLIFSLVYLVQHPGIVRVRKGEEHDR